MIYLDYKFEINEEGLKFSDVDEHGNEYDQLKINRTPFNVGDTFVLELDENDCLFFRRVDHHPELIQLELDI